MSRSVHHGGRRRRARGRLILRLLPAMAALAVPFAMLGAQDRPPVSGQPLTLEAATTRALEHNLELRQVRADTGLARAELVGSRLRPNPSLAAEFLTNGDGRVSLTQDLQLWGIRGNRIAAATAEQERARYTALDAARQVRRDVTSAYRELVFQEERVALLDSLARLNQRIAHAAQLAFAQGLGSELDSRLSLAAFEQARLDRDAAAWQYDIRQVDLARLLGDSLTARYLPSDTLAATRLGFLRPASARTPPAAPGRYEPDSSAVDSLVQLALGRRPDVRAAEFAVDAQRSARAAAVGAGKPTIALGAIYGRNRDQVAAGAQPQTVTDNGFGVGLVIGLPIRNRNQGVIARAEFAGAAAAIRLADVRQLVERDVRTAVNRVALAASSIEALRDVILPANLAALRLAQAAFARGQINIFQVLQVQRSYVESTTSLLGATREYTTALADLEAAVGGPIQ